MTSTAAQPQPPERDDSSSLKRFGSLLRPYSGRIILVLLMLVGLALINLVIPFFLKLLIDRVFPERNIELLVAILAGIVGVYIFRNSLYFMSKYFAVAIGEDVSFTLRTKLFEHLQNLNLQFYRNNKPGQISSRVMDDSFSIQSFIQDELPTLLQAVLRFLVLIAVIYAMNWQLALASTIILPLHLYAFYRFKRPIKTSGRDAQEQLSAVYGNFIEKFLGAEVVKGFSGEERENESFQQAIDLSRKSQLKSKTYHITQKIVADLLVGIGTVALIAFGAYQVMKPQDSMAVGTFFQFFGYVAMLYPTVGELMSGLAKLTKSTASVDRVFELLESEKPEQRRAQVETAPTAGAIRFERVHFTYDETVPVLRDVSVDVKPGQVVAITGPSGAGKSTLVSLVPRFNEVGRGRVLIDGVESTAYDVRQLRKAVGIAFQECFLFNSSILENLRYARPNASMEEIVEVARATGAHEVISRLPKGYHTRVGENGVSLSRGEKQRLALTRALLKQPKILIMDEATSSIDALSEAQIVPQVLELMKDSTVLMITHRAEMVKHADVVVQIVEGRVVYQGPPEDAVMELMGDFASRADRRKLAKPIRPRKRPGGTGFWAAMSAWALAGALALTSLTGGAVFAAEAPAADAKQPDAKPAAKADDNKQPEKAQPAAAPAAAPIAATPAEGGPTSSAIFEAMPKLNALELREALDIASTQAQAVLGYELATPVQTAILPQPPTGVQVMHTLTKPGPNGASFLQMGFREFRSQPIHLWVFGQVVTENGPSPNPDLKQARQFITSAQAVREEMVAGLTAADLSIEPLRLSYVDASHAMGVLKSMGYATIEYTEKGKVVGKNPGIEPSSKVDPKQLPIVMHMPEPLNVDLVGGPKGLDTQMPYTNASELMQLMVFFDPAHPEQYAELRDLVRNDIDVPARQILIEAMVLEISEVGLDQLGVNWQLASPQGNLQSLGLGRLPTFNARNNELPTLTATFDDVFGEFSVQIQALIRKGQAEILSRPSVLTLDNRQARIQVGEEIPIATTVSGLTSGDKLSFNFRYEPVGIFLNVRPRISADAGEVSVQIEGTVSAEVPGQDLIIFDASGQELARAPRLSKREVRTYARIANNTPFIIGGLISRDMEKTVDKVPLLGDIPVIKHAFRTERVDTLKREVIIVITPYVLPEEHLVGRSLPKDEDQFDSFGNRLFRDAYRIRAEDVFDLAFITENRQLRGFRHAVERALSVDARLGRRYPFNQFVNNRFPGEEILVLRQMYEVIKRREIDEKVEIDRVIFFQPDENEASGFSVAFMPPYLSDITNTPLGKKGEIDPVIEALGGKCLALIYTSRPRGDIEEVLRQPVPEVKLLDCPDSETWSELLWSYNQPDDQGNQRHTILIRNMKDLTRLKRALVLKRTVGINASDGLALDNFSIGRLLLMPDVKDDQVFLVDDEVAKYFFVTEQYYPALQQRLEDDTEALVEALRRHDLDHLVPRSLQDRMIAPDNLPALRD